jgi:hypothetical protein
VCEASCRQRAAPAHVLPREMSSPVVGPAQGSARGGDADGGPAQANCEDAGAAAAGEGAGEAQKEARPNIGFSAKRCAVAAWPWPPCAACCARPRVLLLPLAPRGSCPAHELDRASRVRGTAVRSKSRWRSATHGARTTSASGATHLLCTQRGRSSCARAIRALLCTATTC